MRTSACLCARRDPLFWPVRRQRRGSVPGSCALRPIATRVRRRRHRVSSRRCEHRRGRWRFPRAAKAAGRRTAESEPVPARGRARSRGVCPWRNRRRRDHRVAIRLSSLWHERGRASDAALRLADVASGRVARLLRARRSLGRGRPIAARRCRDWRRCGSARDAGGWRRGGCRRPSPLGPSASGAPRGRRVRRRSVRATSSVVRV